MMRDVRALVIALVLGSALTACGSKAGTSGGAAAPAAVASAFPAARFVPARPTYVVSARSMRDAQAALLQLLDWVGMLEGFEASEAGPELSRLFGVDPFSAEGVASTGIDLDGSVAMFSEDVNPTFVIHLKSPEAMQSFIDAQRQKGLSTQSVVVDGIEVFSVRADEDVKVSWAIDNEWLWVHLTFDDGGEGVEWFEHSRRPTGASWADAWTWAKGLGGAQAGAVVGAMDLVGMLEKIGIKAPDALACAKHVAAVKRVGLNFDIDAKRVAAQLAIDVGDTAASLRQQLLPLPPGWGAASANAPLAFEWNLDLPATTAWLEVCTGDDNMREAVAQTGLRSLRAFLHELDIGDKEGVGAVAADLVSAGFFRTMLEQVPGRSLAESSRTFGQYQGKHLKIPFLFEADYVLTDQLAIGAMGDGVLAKIGTGAAPTDGPAVMVAGVRPQGLPQNVWQELFDALDMREPKRLAQRLMLWTELSLGARVDGSSLVFHAHGIRR